MVKVLQDIWIITDGGISCFTRVFNKNLNEQLFGALLSALNIFAEEVTQGGLTNFEIQNNRFTIMKEKGFIFVSKSSKKIKENKVNEELEKVKKKFFDKYKEIVLDDWDGDISIFEDFEKSIMDTLEDPIKKFWHDL